MKSCITRTKLFLLLLVITLFSCIEENCSSCNEHNSYNEQFTVSFHGSYAVTKSSSAFKAGVESSIFTYYSGEDPSVKKEHPGTPVSVISDLYGNFQLTNNLSLYLAPGYYDFYAISSNSSSLDDISFKMGQSLTLKNGTDYLWAQRKNVAICDHSKIEFSFSHIAVSIVIEVNPKMGSQIDSGHVELTKAIIGLPNTNQRLKLAYGKITPAKSITSLKAEMNITQNIANYLLLPIEQKIDIPIELHITTISHSKQTSQETYYCKLPSPPNGFEGGMQYKYRATISTRKIIFDNASVEQWNEKELDNIVLSENI